MHSLLKNLFSRGGKLDQNSKFINLFEDLKSVCNQIAGIQNGKNFEVERASNRNFLVRQNKRFINQIKDIFNYYKLCEVVLFFLSVI